MTPFTPDTLAVAATLLPLILYELRAAHIRRRGAGAARAAHPQLRADWFASVSTAPGTEILAVQTLRNSMMAASLLASTAVLGLTAAIGLFAPLLRASLERGPVSTAWRPQVVLELLFFVLLFASVLLSVLAIRYYHHASFVGGMPVGSTERARWLQAGTTYVRRGGVFYSWSLRVLILALPPLAFMLSPFTGVSAAFIAVAVLHQFDQAHRVDGGDDGPGKGPTGSSPPAT
jgi:hypothetical protein